MAYHSLRNHLHQIRVTPVEGHCGAPLWFLCAVELAERSKVTQLDSLPRKNDPGWRGTPLFLVSVASRFFTKHQKNFFSQKKMQRTENPSRRRGEGKRASETQNVSPSCDRLVCETVKIVFRCSPISLRRVRKESDQLKAGRMEGGRREREMKTKPKICTCKHHTSTESKNEENTGFTLVSLQVRSPGGGNQDNQESGTKSGEDRKRRKEKKDS